LGKLVVFEGIDNAGKTSVIERLKVLLENCNVPVTVCGELRSPLASILRELLNSEGSPFLKTYFFACDRAWSYERIGLPALQRGELVLWDRYVDSAIVYRTVELANVSSKINLEFVKSINQPFKEADLTIYIDISVETAFKRIKQGWGKVLYNPEFLEKVRAEYLKLAIKKRYCVINGESSLGIVANRVGRAIQQHLKELFLCI